MCGFAEEAKIPVPLLKVRGFVSDINCDLYIFPQFCDFERSRIIFPAP